LGPGVKTLKREFMERVLGRQNCDTLVPYKRVELTEEGTTEKEQQKADPPVGGD